MKQSTQIILSLLMPLLFLCLPMIQMFVYHPDNNDYGLFYWWINLSVMYWIIFKILNYKKGNEC